MPKIDDQSRFVPEPLEVYRKEVENALDKLNSSFSEAEEGINDWLVDGAESSLLGRFRQCLNEQLAAGQNQESIADDLAIVKRTAVTKFLSEKGGLSTRSLSAIKLSYNVQFPTHRDMMMEGIVFVARALRNATSYRTDEAFRKEHAWFLYRIYTNADLFTSKIKQNHAGTELRTFGQLKEAMFGLTSGIDDILSEVSSLYHVSLTQKDTQYLIEEWTKPFLAAVHLVACKFKREKSSPRKGQFPKEGNSK